MVPIIIIQLSFCTWLKLTKSSTWPLLSTTILKREKGSPAGQSLCPYLSQNCAVGESGKQFRDRKSAWRVDWGMLSFCIIIHYIYGSQLSLHGHLTMMNSQKKVLTVSVLERDDCIPSRPNDSSKEEKVTIRLFINHVLQRKEKLYHFKVHLTPNFSFG